MMDDFSQYNDFNYNDEVELKKLLQRFEQMLENGDSYFFDPDEYEDIIDYCLNHRKLKLAGKILKVATEQYPDNIELLLRKAHYLSRTNKTNKALDLLADLQSQDPFNIDINIAKASLYNKLRKYKDEIREYKLAIKNSQTPPEDTSAIYTYIAGAYMQLQDFDNAIIYLQKNLEIDPHNDLIFHELSAIYEITDRIEEALVYFNRFIDKHPYSITAWEILGDFYNSYGLYEKAVDAYEFCIAIDPLHPDPYLGKAMSLYNLEKYAEALEDLEEHLRLDIYSVRGLIVRGNCYQNLNNDKLAIKNYRNAVNLDDTFWEGYYELARVYCKLGTYKSALTAARKAHKLNPENLDCILVLAQSQKGMGLMEEAAHSYELALDNNSGDSGVWLRYSDLYADQGDYNTAYTIVDRGVAIEPKNVDLLLRGAAYLYFMGKPKDAIATLEWALTLPGIDIQDLIDYAPELLNDPEIQELINYK